MSLDLKHGYSPKEYERSFASLTEQSLVDPSDINSLADLEAYASPTARALRSLSMAIGNTDVGVNVSDDSSQRLLHGTVSELTQDIDGGFEFRVISDETLVVIEKRSKKPTPAVGTISQTYLITVPPVGFLSFPRLDVFAVDGYSDTISPLSNPNETYPMRRYAQILQKAAYEARRTLPRS